MACKFGDKNQQGPHTKESQRNNKAAGRNQHV